MTTTIVFWALFALATVGLWWAIGFAVQLGIYAIAPGMPLGLPASTRRLMPWCGPLLLYVGLKLLLDGRGDREG